MRCGTGAGVIFKSVELLLSHPCTAPLHAAAPLALPKRAEGCASDPGAAEPPPACWHPRHAATLAPTATLVLRLAGRLTLNGGTGGSSLGALGQPGRSLENGTFIAKELVAHHCELNQVGLFFPFVKINRSL